jgi:peptide/nickel transport system substrate-binding protein
MKRSFSRLAATSCLLLIAAAAHASSRPRYGGTVRILLRDGVNSLDPAGEDAHPATRDRMAGLIFETLTSLDDQGRLRPKLAGSWSSDPAKRIWTFRLRLAKFHDGTTVTAPDVVASLTRAGVALKLNAPDRLTVTVEANSPVLHMPEMMALAKYAIVKRQADGSLLGTGSYKLAEWQPGQRALFSANEDYWNGRSFPDAIEVLMGASLREQLALRQISPYSAAELTLEELDQAGQNVMLSRPADLLVLVFPLPDGAPAPGRPLRKSVDPRVREALSASLDRAAISNAVLQRKGQPASGLLPQWLTGYEFLLPVPADRAHAAKLVSDVNVGAPAAPITIAYDSSDPVAKRVADRIAVDAGQAGLRVRPYGDVHVNTKSGQASLTADAILLRLPLPSLEPSVALASLAASVGLDADSGSAILSAGRPEDLYEIERKLLENFRAIPVARLSQAVWLGGNTHSWQQLPTGAWDLDQLWVEGAK